MLKDEKQIEMALRLYDNPTFGTTFGKGLYRRAIYNGSIDTKLPSVKYVIYLYGYNDWSNQAKTDGQMTVFNSVQEEKEKLYSWINRYDPLSKLKALVIGVCTLDLQTNNMSVLIYDEGMGVMEHWQVTAKLCKNKSDGKKAPILLATNTDLQSW